MRHSHQILVVRSPSCDFYCIRKSAGTIYSRRCSSQRFDCLLTSVDRGGSADECGATMTRDASQIERDDRLAESIAIVPGNIYFLTSTQSRDVAGSSLGRAGKGRGCLKNRPRCSFPRESKKRDDSPERGKDEGEQRRGGGGRSLRSSRRIVYHRASELHARMRRGSVTPN